MDQSRFVWGWWSDKEFESTPGSPSSGANPEEAEGEKFNLAPNVGSNQSFCFSLRPFWSTLIGMTADTAKTIADFLLQQTEQEYATTCKVLAAVPEEQSSYKPGEKCMSGLELATHIAASEPFFLRGVISGAFEWKQSDCKTPAEALAFYQESVPGLIAEARALSGEKLAAPIAFGPWNEPAVNYLAINLKHGVHHRGQLSAYLRPMGAKVPSIYGPSADENPWA